MSGPFHYLYKMLQLNEDRFKRILSFGPDQCCLATVAIHYFLEQPEDLNFACRYLRNNAQSNVCSIEEAQKLLHLNLGDDPYRYHTIPAKIGERLFQDIKPFPMLIVCQVLRWMFLHGLNTNVSNLDRLGPKLLPVCDIDHSDHEYFSSQTPVIRTKQVSISASLMSFVCAHWVTHPLPESGNFQGPQFGYIASFAFYLAV